ncbi:polysaccharide pyruvyl transferase family protein [Methylobacillus methanolivorans]|uniref:Polysaccharide pyruvyl transferase family protein n=1 Tax=Methylobacillus methanolivorans TaxID=1848927 RepID=A0ABW8GHN1_9PROT
MNMHLENLKNKLDIITQCIEDKNDVIFLDTPLYYNVGDILIYEGTMRYFKDKGVAIKKDIPKEFFDPERLSIYITNKTTIILQGGGNFGDIYPAHQMLREAVIKYFPNNRIIQLPQTMFFSKQENVVNAISVFKQHTNIVMFARDMPTLKIFQQLTDKAYLMPDMAHYLYGNLPLAKSTTRDVLLFIRKDVEAASDQNQLINAEGCYVDWADLVTKKDKIILKVVRKVKSLSTKLDIEIFDKIATFIWRSNSTYLASKFAKFFSSYKKVVTSRLHGHILSCIVETPSELIDNNYGKNTAYYDTWTKPLTFTSKLKVPDVD